MSLRFSTVLEISALHLSEGTLQWLEDGIQPERAPWIPTLFKGDMGWLIATFHVAEGRGWWEANWPGSLPPDLELCLGLGVTNECTWVLFDPELEPRDLLPTYFDNKIFRAPHSHPGSKQVLRSRSQAQDIITWRGNPYYGWPTAHEGIEALQPPEGSSVRWGTWFES